MHPDNEDYGADCDRSSHFRASTQKNFHLDPPANTYAENLALVLSAQTTMLLGHLRLNMPECMPLQRLSLWVFTQTACLHCSNNSAAIFKWPKRLLVPLISGANWQYDGDDIEVVVFICIIVVLLQALALGKLREKLGEEKLHEGGNEEWKKGYTSMDDEESDAKTVKPEKEEEGSQGSKKEDEDESEGNWAREEVEKPMPWGTGKKNQNRIEEDAVDGQAGENEDNGNTFLADALKSGTEDCKEEGGPVLKRAQEATKQTEKIDKEHKEKKEHESGGGEGDEEEEEEAPTAPDIHNDLLAQLNRALRKSSCKRAVNYKIDRRAERRARMEEI